MWERLTSFSRERGMSRVFDVIVLGSSGTVGKLVCEHLANQYQVRTEIHNTVVMHLCCTGDLETRNIDVSDCLIVRRSRL